MASANDDEENDVLFTLGVGFILLATLMGMGTMAWLAYRCYNSCLLPIWKWLRSPRIVGKPWWHATWGTETPVHFRALSVGPLQGAPRSDTRNVRRRGQAVLEAQGPH